MDKYLVLDWGGGLGTKNLSSTFRRSKLKILVYFSKQLEKPKKNSEEQELNIFTQN